MSIPGLKYSKASMTTQQPPKGQVFPPDVRERLDTNAMYQRILKSASSSVDASSASTGSVRSSRKEFRTRQVQSAGRTVIDTFCSRATLF